MHIVRIKDIMKKRDRSVSFLQRETGISRYSLDLIVDVIKSPTIEQIKKIVEVLEVPVNDILVIINV